MLARRCAIGAAFLIGGAGAATSIQQRPALCQEQGSPSWLARAAAVGLAASVAAAASMSWNQKRHQDDEVTAPWHARWNQGMTNWHLSDVHPQLVRYGGRLLDDGVSAAYFPKRILFPLCGKTVDMPFLASQGHHVTGVDCVRKAADEFSANFSRGGVDEWTKREGMMVGNIPMNKDADGKDVVSFVVGDWFKMTEKVAGRFEACFDRGGLVAINPELRADYVASLDRVLDKGARILLVTVEHDAFARGKLGPPFSVPEEQVRQLFGAKYSVELLMREDRMPIEDVWKKRGCTWFNEATYIITKRA